MSRTDLDAVTLANSLRMKAGDGSIEWVSEPIQASVLLDIADMLDENVKLKQELEAVGTAAYLYGRNDLSDENAKLRELLQRLLAEYRYLRVRPRKMYLQHEQRMRAIEDEMCELGIEVDE